MSKISINEVLGIRQAEITLGDSGVTVVTGENASGKSSFAVACAAVLSRRDNPLGAAGTQTKLYTNDNADRGEVVLSGDEGTVRWSLPSGDMSQEPDVVHSSAAATGLEDFISTRSPKALADLWEGLFLPKAHLMKQVIESHLSKILDEVSVARVVQRIIEVEADPTQPSDKGWNEVSDAFAMRARNAKREWTGITGEAFGKAKGADWLPAQWLSEYDAVASEDADRAVKDQEQLVQAAYVAHAVDAAEVQAAKDAKAKIPEVEARIKELGSALEDAEKFAAPFRKAFQMAREQLSKAEGQQQEIRRNANRMLDRGDRVKCPCDKEFVYIKGTGLVPVEDNAAMIEAIQKSEDEAREAVHAATERKEAAEQDAREPLGKIAEVKRELDSAKIELQGLTRQAESADATVRTEEMVRDIERSKAELEKLRQMKTCIFQRDEARVHYENAVTWERVAKALSPKGIRAKLMEDRVTLVNRVLERLCAITVWPKMQIGTGYSLIVQNRRLLRMCSESERLRAQYLMQIAVARVRRDPVVILDRVDVLDQGNLATLCQLVGGLAQKEPPTNFILCGTELSLSGLEGFDVHRIVDGDMARVQ